MFHFTRFLTRSRRSSIMIGRGAHPRFPDTGFELHQRLNLAVAFLLFSIASYAQCPSSITTTPAVATAATCPSSGQILVHSSAESEPSATYQIISGPASGGYQTTSQSSSHFTGLPAGSYTIRITCGTVFADVTATVADEYTPLSLTAAVSNECAIGGGGGNNRNNATTNAGAYITATANGGMAPLMYAFLLSDNAAEPDANFTYGTENIYTATSFGVYQVRVKDACNNFITQSVDVKPIYPQAKVTLAYNGAQCNGSLAKASLRREDDNTIIDPTNSAYAVDIWYLAAGAPCTIPTSVGPDHSVIVMSESDLDLAFPSTAESVLIRTVSRCGETTVACYPLQKPELKSWAQVHVGCSPTDSVNIAFDIYDGVYPYNVTIQGFDASDNPVPGTDQSFQFHYSNTYTFPNAHHYTYVVSDACEDSLTRTIYTPTPANGPVVTWFDTKLDCVGATGTFNVVLEINGYVPNHDFSSFKLVDAATNTFVANATVYTLYNGAIYFEQIFPGSYKVVITPTDPTCPPTEVPVTIPPTEPTLTFSLDGSVTQLCGGAGTITADLDYNGTQVITYELLQGTTIIASNATGSFTNLEPGTYTLKAIADMSDCGQANMEITKELIVQPQGSAPVVLKKLGVNCTGSTTTGMAVFEFSGFGPFLLEMKKVTETNYTTIGTAVPNNYTAEGLSADTDYDVRITDQCGKTSVTQVSIKPLVAVYVTNTAQPCLGQPYTLSAEEITNASYSWTFNGGPEIATSKDIVFASYAAANNGTYVCTITLEDCITKVVTVNLNSINCNQPLAKSGLGNYVWIDTKDLGTQNATEVGAAGITVTLYDSDGVTVLLTTTTDATGYYSFADLPAGSYIVGFSGLPSGYIFSPIIGSLNDGSNNDADFNGKTVVITLADNEFNMNVDAGIWYSLPVTLISFEAKAMDEGILLNWATTTETNSDRFEIERSPDGKKWQKIGIVHSHGESASVKRYEFKDREPLQNQNLYRLRMVDFDMSFSFSGIRSVNYSFKEEVGAYPNPATEFLYLKGFTTGKVKEISIINSNGQKIFTSRKFSNEGINVAHLLPGLYIVNVKGTDNQYRSFKVMISK
ncbi:SdrD B-like domain-containing protein [Dyadobacter aurulentus]|uniref:SdrD B-like domain-containing protein n=1 Tax=Dyadobacter sp. UC 10 TaxID=2605428 RepID=UPI0011F31661|nr:SdrD B-like domain-containing protein [Dyadobacter sp. UC 10]KAA0992046.1 T9SS type A sorting domain-containing protein [Dyadobacter sp. UC 10]